jgi:hypothetical protein
MNRTREGPRWAIGLINWMAGQKDAAEILGDFQETYAERLAHRGTLMARLWYWRQTLRLTVVLVPRRLRCGYAQANSIARDRASLASKRVGVSLQPGLLAVRGSPVSGFFQDVRSATREVRRDFHFYAFAAVIVGLGIGANTAVFSVMNPLLLRALPFEVPEELVWVAQSRAEGNLSLVTSRTSNLRDFRDMNQTFRALTGYDAFFEYLSYDLVGEGEPERLVGGGGGPRFPGSPWRPASARQEFRGGGERLGRAPRCHSDPRLVGEAFRGRSGRRWSLDHSKRPTHRSRGRAATHV